MDYKTVEGSIRKALDFMKLKADTGSRVYGKSRACLKNIAEMCCQIIDVVAGLVQIEGQGSAEPAELRGEEDLQKKIDFLVEEMKNLSKKVDEIKNFGCFEEQSKPKVTEQAKKKTTEKAVAEKVTAEKAVAGEGVTEKATAVRFSKEELKEIIKQYGTTLEQLAKTDSGVAVANECARVLWRWFEGRINKKYAHIKPFNYLAWQIKDIIYALVIFFGYKFEQGKKEEFVQELDEWLKNLSIDPKSNTWRAPWGVFCIEQEYRKNKRIDRKCATLTAVVIWDILVDNGLDTLCKIEAHDNVYVRDTAIWDIVEKTDINLLDPYKNFKFDPTIIDRLNLR